MKFATPKIRPPVKIHGGKALLARRIITELPNVPILVDVFGGAGSISLNSDNSGSTVYRDADTSLVNLMQVLRNDFETFWAAVKKLKYEEETFLAFKNPILNVTNDPVYLALETYVLHRMSRGGMGRAFAWSERLRGGKPGDLNAWETMIEHLPALHKRLQSIEILRADFRDTLRHFDRPDAVLYLDPPYLPETRSKGARAVYTHEMTRGDHEDLLRLVNNVTRCKVAISGYDSELYRTSLGDWRTVSFSVPNNAGQGRQKQDRIEILWMNYDNKDRRTS